MDNTSDLYEESFQPDYNEWDEESDSISVVSLSVGVPASEKLRKIIIKKPSVERVPASATTRRKRPWKSASSRNDTASIVSSTCTAVETADETAVDATVVVSSLEATSMQPSSVVAAETEACDPPNSSIADEVLVGDG